MTVQVSSEVRCRRSHSAGVANSCELPIVGAGNQTPEQGLYPLNMGWGGFSPWNRALWTYPWPKRASSKDCGSSCLLVTLRALFALFPRMASFLQHSP